MPTFRPIQGLRVEDCHDLRRHGTVGKQWDTPSGDRQRCTAWQVSLRQELESLVRIAPRVVHVIDIDESLDGRESILLPYTLTQTE